MDKDAAERVDLERRISESGWHILRDEQVADGYVVEYQQGAPDGYHLRAETRKSTGVDRNDAYRRFLTDIAARRPAAVR